MRPGMQVCLALLCFLVSGICSLLESRGVRASFSFGPLIGGPSWLKVHIKTRLECESGEVAVLDFVPALASVEDIPRNNARLLLGQSVDGLVRVKFNSPEGPKNATLVALAEKIYEENSSRKLHLYRNNCYHFAYRAWRTVFDN